MPGGVAVASAVRWLVEPTCLWSWVLTRRLALVQIKEVARPAGVLGPYGASSLAKLGIADRWSAPFASAVRWLVLGP